MKFFYCAVYSLLVALATGCSHTQADLREKVANSDSAAINFFKGDGTMDTVVSVRIIKDRQTIEKLANFITANITAFRSKCGSDGSVHFFKNNTVVQDVFFRMNEPGCSQFSFMRNGKWFAGDLTTGAGEFMQQLKNQ